MAQWGISGDSFMDEDSDTEMTPGTMDELIKQDEEERRQGEKLIQEKRDTIEGLKAKLAKLHAEMEAKGIDKENPGQGKDKMQQLEELLTAKQKTILGFLGLEPHEHEAIISGRRDMYMRLFLSSHFTAHMVRERLAGFKTEIKTQIEALENQELKQAFKELLASYKDEAEAAFQTSLARLMDAQAAMFPKN